MTAPPIRKPDMREVLAAYVERKGLYAWHHLTIELGYPRKRVYFLLEKADGLGLLDCGVSPRSGWVTEAGLAWLAAH